MANAAKPRGINVVLTAGAEGEEGSAGTLAAVAVVMPVQLAILGNGTESDKEYVTPFYVSHLFWDCLLNSPGISAPIKTHMLIDSGSYTVIMDRKQVERLALQHQKLPSP